MFQCFVIPSVTGEEAREARKLDLAMH